MLTGQPPGGHGVVGNGWHFRDTGEVRFWQQSNPLIQAEPLYATARRLAAGRGRPFRAAKLFWWFNQGADVDLSVTPKPYYARRRQQGVRHPRHARRPDRPPRGASSARSRSPPSGGRRPACPAPTGSPGAPPRCSATNGPT